MENSKPIKYFGTPLGILDFYKRMVLDDEFVEIDLRLEFHQRAEKHFSDKNGEKIINEFYADGRTIVYNEEDYLQLRSTHERMDTLNNIEQLIASEESENKQKFILKHLISDINYYLIKSDFLMDDYPFFIADLKRLKEDIILKFSYLIDKEDIISALFDKRGVVTTQPKIKWLGQKKVLITLLFDLWIGQYKNNKMQPKKLEPLMSFSSTGDLMNFILNNFVDRDGNPFPEGSLFGSLNENIEKFHKEGEVISKIIELDY